MGRTGRILVSAGAVVVLAGFAAVLYGMWAFEPRRLPVAAIAEREFDDGVKVELLRQAQIAGPPIYTARFGTRELGYRINGLGALPGAPRPVSISRDTPEAVTIGFERPLADGSRALAVAPGPDRFPREYVEVRADGSVTRQARN